MWSGLPLYQVVALRLSAEAFELAGDGAGIKYLSKAYTHTVFPMLRFVLSRRVKRNHTAVPIR